MLKSAARDFLKSLCFVVLIVSSLVGPAAAALAQDSPELLTVAESSNYEQTSTSAEVGEYLEKLKELAPRLSFDSIGLTTEGRPLHSIRFQGSLADPAAEPLRVLVIANIHSGECDGKEAMLALLRDLGTAAEHRWSQAPLDLVIVPNYNADGNDRRGAGHRPGQVGPEVMGIRENAQQLDLNRDFIKLEAPETRALIALANVFEPHVFIDCHTTNGSRHGYTLTYDIPHHPATSAAIRSELSERIMPTVSSRLGAEGIPTFYYGNFNPDRTRWSTYGYEPRYSTEYFGLRGVLAILSESYSYASYRDRVVSSRAFVEACIDAILERRSEIIPMLASERERGLTNVEPVALRAELGLLTEKQVVLYRNEEGNDEALELEFWGKYNATDAVLAPAAYILDPEASWVAERLFWHGVQVERLEEDWHGTVDAWICRERAQQEMFQGHSRNDLTVAPISQERTIEAGSFIVRLAQPQARLIVQMLEPRGIDSLFAWNFFDDSLAVEQPLNVYRVPTNEQLQAMTLQSLAVIEPSETLTIGEVWGPTGRIDLSGSADMNLSWASDQPHRLRRRWNNRPVIVDVTTGSMESEPQAAEDPTEALVKLLSGWEGMDERAARAAARRATSNSDQTLYVFTSNNNLALIDRGAEQVRWLTTGEESVELVEFSPRGDQVAFVRGNDLNVVDIASGQVIEITQAGDATHFYGKFDWVYQEELYGRGNFKAYWWSPNGEYIALLGLDETQVPSFTVTDHLPVHQELEVSSYPKAGDPNPTVSLGVWSRSQGALEWVDLSVTETPEPLISRVSWSKQTNRLLYQIQDREQTFLDLREFDPQSKVNSLLIREESPAWIESPGEPTWLADGRFLWLSPRSGSNHLYLYSGNGDLEQTLTSGPGEVRSIVKVDEERGELWFTATFDSRIENHAYRVSLAGGDAMRVTELGWSHSVRVSPSGEYLIDTASQAARPIQVRLIDRDGEVRQLLEPNLPDRLRHVRILAPETLQVEARDGHLLDAQIIRPYDFNPNGRYPVLIYVYSGPQAPTVRQSWGGTTYLWHQMLAQQGYVIWMCDNRSATYGGASDAWPIHRNLGENELKDIEDGIRWLKSQPWVDGDRIGIWGWSYGGYMSAYALTHSQSFRLGIAGAPVTDWKNYDSIYTERYMGLPSNNADGYRTSSVVEAAGNLQGHLLLIHGSMDDNVHLTNTLQLVYELQKAGKDFDLMIYPRNRHGVTDPLQNRHLRELMTRTILEKL